MIGKRGNESALNGLHSQPFFFLFDDMEIGEYKLYRRIVI